MILRSESLAPTKPWAISAGNISSTPFESVTLTLRDAGRYRAAVARIERWSVLEISMDFSPKLSQSVKILLDRPQPHSSVFQTGTKCISNDVGLSVLDGDAKLKIVADDVHVWRAVIIWINHESEIFVFDTGHDSLPNMLGFWEDYRVSGGRLDFCIDRKGLNDQKL